MAQKHENDEFVFQNEFEKYCADDVKLLTEGCLRYRNVSMKATINPSIQNDTGVDPFRTSCTLASYCSHVYRRNFMPSNLIAIIPDNGYNPKQNTSIKCQNWLKLWSYQNKSDIQHARNKGEYKCGEYLLDGIDHENKVIFEFHGCFFHGCPVFYNDKTFNTVRQLSMSTIYQRH